MDSRSAWRRIRAAALLVIAGGMVAGALGGALVMRLAGPAMADRLGQRWLAVETPWSPAVLLVVLAICFCCTPAKLTSALSRRPLLLSPGLSGRGGSTLAVITVAGGLALVAISAFPGRGGIDVDSPVLLGLMGMSLSAAGAVLLGRAVPPLGQPPATRATVKWLADHVVLVSLVTAIAAAGASTYSAFLTRDTNALAEANLTNQKEGSLIVSGVPEAIATTLVGDYRDRGGQDVRTIHLPQQAAAPSVTTPAFADCMREGTFAACNELVDPASQVIASVGLDPELPSSSPPKAADAAVQDGRIGLLLFDAGRLERAEVRVAAAVTDPDLRIDAPMPAVLLSPGSELAVELGIRPSGIVDIELADFDGLSVVDSTEFRGLVRRMAPTAQVIEPDVDSAFLEKELGLANLIAILTAALCAGVGLASGTALAVSNAPTRRLLAEISASVLRRLMIAFWVLLPAVAAAAFIVTSVPWLTARWSGAGAEIGWSWLLPPAALFASSLVSAVALVRNPAR